MIVFVKPFYGCLLLCSALALGGCTSSSSASLEEEKEPHFLEGKSRANMMDYTGALESFEQALEVNPKSAAAHFEIGCLCDQKEGDPAAAIYHYGRYLKFRPHGDKAERARGRITACQQALARFVSLGPVTQGLQREQDVLVEQIKRLTEDNRMLREKLDRIEASANPPRLPAQSSRPDSLASTGTGSAAVSALPVARTLPVDAGRGVSNSSRSHTVAPGETPAAIAKRYGVKLETLMAANPRLEPRRMRVGQTVNIPAS